MQEYFSQRVEAGMRTQVNLNGNNIHKDNLAFYDTGKAPDEELNEKAVEKLEFNAHTVLVMRGT
jgi:hypothetical protein